MVHLILRKLFENVCKIGCITINAWSSGVPTTNQLWLQMTKVSLTYVILITVDLCQSIIENLLIFHKDVRAWSDHSILYASFGSCTSYSLRDHPLGIGFTTLREIVIIEKFLMRGFIFEENGLTFCLRGWVIDFETCSKINWVDSEVRILIFTSTRSTFKTKSAIIRPPCPLINWGSISLKHGTLWNYDFSFKRSTRCLSFLLTISTNYTSLNRVERNQMLRISLFSLFSLFKQFR